MRCILFRLEGTIFGSRGEVMRGSEAVLSTLHRHMTLHAVTAWELSSMHGRLRAYGLDAYFDTTSAIRDEVISTVLWLGNNYEKCPLKDILVVSHDFRDLIAPKKVGAQVLLGNIEALCACLCA